jgi:hypothetical protein
MAASIYSSIPTQQRTQAGKEEITHGRIAAQAWALYEAVEKEGAQRHSRT